MATARVRGGLERELTRAAARGRVAEGGASPCALASPGGVRALDIRDPFNPKEIGYYIPQVNAKTDKRCVGRGADERCKIAIQTNNVNLDDRGYIYIVDRANTGLHILELSGAARRVANFPSNSTN